MVLPGAWRGIIGRLELGESLASLSEDEGISEIGKPRLHFRSCNDDMVGKERLRLRQCTTHGENNGGPFFHSVEPA